MNRPTRIYRVTSLDVLATVLEEMPPFPEKESCGLLNLLKKKRPGRVPDNPEIKANDDDDEAENKKPKNQGRKSSFDKSEIDNQLVLN